MIINSGIYCIKNIIDNKCYIGSAKDIRRRKSIHFYKLNNNIHHNFHLQNAFNKYGSEKFIFHILEFVDNPDDLIELEQWWIDSCNPEYNVLRKAYSMLGYKHSDLSKIKISQALSGHKKSAQHVENNSKCRIGSKQSTATILKKSQAISKSVNQIDIITNEIINTFSSIKLASDILGIKANGISAVCRNRQKTCGGFAWEYC